MKDSFWAIFGNGLGYFFLLLSGIMIARFLGPDLYGEYGVVKTNMFYMAGFACFGLVFTSTRYISKFITENATKVRRVIRLSISITLVFSLTIAIMLMIFAGTLSEYLEEPDLKDVFKVLSILIVVKALISTGNGILAGLKEFKHIGIYNIISGLTMLATCIPLTYYYKLTGALISLTLSQLVCLVLNYLNISRIYRNLPKSETVDFRALDLLSFSLPLALLEISYSLSNWLGIMIITKYSTLSQVAYYSAGAQWQAIISFIPGLLANVVLSHLGGQQAHQQHSMISKIGLIYLICSVIPAFIVLAFNGLIVDIYGGAYVALKSVLIVNIIASIPSVFSDLFKSELIALGKPWALSLLRLSRDCIIVLLGLYLIRHYDGIDGALYYSISYLVGTCIFLLGAYVIFKYLSSNHSIRNEEIE